MEMALTKKGFKLLYLLNLVISLIIIISLEEISAKSLAKCRVNSILDKNNRDGKNPKFPLTEDFRVKSSYIYKAHEILENGLKQFLNHSEEADLGIYLSRILNERYEKGGVITYYQDVFISIWEQYNETLCENYAVKQLHKDTLDLCSVAKFLSLRPEIKDGETIVRKMEKALKINRCDPCISYPKAKVLWNTICARRKPILVRIRNTNTRELLYAAADDFLSDEGRRRAVFTWGDLDDIPDVAGNAWTGEETWLIETASNTTSATSFFLKNARPSDPPRGYLSVDSNHNPYLSNGFPDGNSAKLSLGASAKWKLLLMNSTDNNGSLTHFCLPENRNAERYNNLTRFVLQNENYDGLYLNADEEDIFININDTSGLRRNTRLMRERSFWEILPIFLWNDDTGLSTGLSWDTGHRGIRLSSNCDFNGNDLSCYPIFTHVQCIDQCYDDRDCTHMAYRASDGFCCIKKANRIEISQPYPGGCGFFPGRSFQKCTYLLL